MKKGTNGLIELAVLGLAIIVVGATAPIWFLVCLLAFALAGAIWSSYREKRSKDTRNRR